MKMASVFKPEILDLITKDDVDIDSLITRMVGRQTDIESRQSISKYVKESDSLQRIKRDGGYGHQCSQPFVIFPFLIFLQSLATTVVNVININNNNNNNAPSSFPRYHRLFRTFLLVSSFWSTWFRPLPGNRRKQYKDGWTLQIGRPELPLVDNRR